ncbi:cytochrome P450, partial [Mycena epipterygia]
TWSAVTVFVLAMLLHPEYQVKAQREIDSVVGTSRLPGFEDREHLPLIECILQETLRFVASVPHRLMQDDVYRGMFIPKGSTVIANIRFDYFLLNTREANPGRCICSGMSLDESIYSFPNSFFPERYLSQPGGRVEPQFDSVYHCVPTLCRPTPVYVNLRVATCGDVRLRAATCVYAVM